MTEKEYESFNGKDPLKKVITPRCLSNQKNRTLLYGYTLERDTFHVYLFGGVIYRIVYKSHIDHSHDIIDFKCSSSFVNNGQFIPSKRLYPERCDYEFCTLLRNAGERLPFTAYYNNIPEEQYYGILHESHY